MKKILTLLFAILTFTTVSQAQEQAFTVQGGYSWSMGMGGVAYQFNHLEIGAGIMPNSGAQITSYSTYLALTKYKPDESGLYTSIGFASQGYHFTAPMGIVNLGYKIQSRYSGLNFKGEVGYGWCEYAKVFTYGITAGWTFGI